MSTKYRIGAQRNAHFVTFTVVKWIDFFIRNEYREVFLNSVRYCQEHKALEVYAYCIMSSHIHMVIRTGEDQKLEDVIRDLKSYTARCFHELLKDKNTTYESRKNWVLLHFKDPQTDKFQFWQTGSHAIELWSDEVFYQKINYIHLNPVVSGFVAQPEHWLYSSARDHAGIKGIINLAIH